MGPGTFTPRLSQSSVSQLYLVTPPVVSVPGLSSELAIPAAAALSTSLWSVASSHSADWCRSRQSPGPLPAPAPPAVPDPLAGRSRTHHQSGGCQCTRDLPASQSQFCSQKCSPSGGCHHTRNLSPSRSRSRSWTCHASGSRTST